MGTPGKARHQTTARAVTELRSGDCDGISVRTPAWLPIGSCNGAIMKPFCCLPSIRHGQTCYRSERVSRLTRFCNHPPGACNRNGSSWAQLRTQVNRVAFSPINWIKTQPTEPLPVNLNACHIDSPQAQTNKQKFKVRHNPHSRQTHTDRVTPDRQ